MIPFVIRPAGLPDQTLLWCWRNDPVTREMERKPGIVPPDIFAGWLNGILLNSKYQVMIAQSDSDAIAVAYIYSSRAGAAEIGICVNPAFRGLGLSCGLLKAFVSRAQADLGFVRISAAVKTSNIPSRRLFTRAGYDIDAIRNGTVYFSRQMPAKKDPPCQACGVSLVGE